MVEVFQNIVRYKKENKQKYEIFSLRSIDDHLHIFSSNVVDLSSYSILKDKLKDINEKDPDDLKKLYLEILKAGVFGEKGGAGLGLLQMARRSSNPIQYNFSPVNEKSKLFQYQLDFSINKGERILERDKVFIGENITLLEEIYERILYFFLKVISKKKMLTPFSTSYKPILGFKQKIKNLTITEFFILPLNSFKIFQDMERM